MADAGLRQAAHDRVVVGDDGEALYAGRKLHQPVGLRLADDVEGEQDVVGDAGVNEDLDLAELLAGDADRRPPPSACGRSPGSCGS